MSTNLFAALKRMLPDSPVWIGEVVAHNDTDDTSTIRLPTGQGDIPFAGAVQGGSLIRARGRTVPVGETAFVRDGLVENRAPSGTPIEYVVAPVTLVAGDLTVLAGGIPAQSGAVGVAFTLDSTAYVTGGTQPLTWSVAAGTLPAGLSLDAATGVISGTPTTEVTGLSVTLRATDAQLRTVDLSVVFTVLAGNALQAVSPNGGYVFAFLGRPDLSNWDDSSNPPPILSDTDTRNLSRLFTGGVAPVTYGLKQSGLPSGYSGSLQPGLSLTSAGIITGSVNPSVLYPSTNVIVVATDATSATAESILGIATLVNSRHPDGGSGGGPTLPTTATVFSRAVQLTFASSAAYTHPTFGILVRDVTISASWGPLTWESGGTQTVPGSTSGTGTAWTGIGLDSRTDAQLFDDILLRTNLGTTVLPADVAELPAGAEAPTTIGTLTFQGRVSGLNAPDDTTAPSPATTNRQVAAGAFSAFPTSNHVFFYRYTP